MIEPPSHWETKRLALRPATSAAAPVAFETYATNPDVWRYMIWRPHRDVVETEQFLDRCENDWQTRRVSVDAAMDIGYVLVPRLWRQGLMSEAVVQP